MIRAAFFDYKTIFAGRHSRPGAEAFVRACAARFPLMLTARASYADAKRSLDNTNFAPLFLDILTDAEVDRPKPAPDLLLATLGRLGFLLRDRNPVEPGECLVVESTSDAIAATRAARMRSLAIAHSTPSANLAGADFLRESFTSVDLDEILRGCARLPPT
jgi:beta-phosphoglucomutase-like phosphatase (HAD superfamily)